MALDRIKRTQNGTLQRGSVIRDANVYPSQSATHLAAVNSNQFDITLDSGVIIPGIGSGAQVGMRTKFGLLPSTDTRVLDLTWTVANGEITITGDRSTITEDGRTKKYFVANRWIDGSIVGMRFHAGTPLQVFAFMVDTSREERLWRGNPTTNAFQLI